MAVNGFTNIVTDGLVLSLDAGNLKSYPTSGTTWTDLTKNGNNGTLTNMGVTGFSSSNLGSIVFDGTNDVVLCGNASSLSFERTNSFSFCCWIYPNSFSSTGILTSKYNASDRGLTFATGVGSLILVLRNAVATNDFVVQTADNSVLINNWYFVVATYNGSSNATGVSFYINGVKTLNNTIVRNGLTATISNTADFMVGARTLANAAYYNGRISNFLTYNKLLSDSEVLQNYNATKWRFI
jgi:hypothetical protein